MEKKDTVIFLLGCAAAFACGLLSSPKSAPKPTSRIQPIVLQPIFHVPPQAAPEVEVTVLPAPAAPLPAIHVAAPAVHCEPQICLGEARVVPVSVDLRLPPGSRLDMPVEVDGVLDEFWPSRPSDARTRQLAEELEAIRVHNRAVSAGHPLPAPLDVQAKELDERGRLKPVPME